MPIPDVGASGVPEPALPLSSVTVPIFVPMEVVRSFLDGEIPAAFAEGETTELIERPGLSASANWNLTRSPLQLSGDDGVLAGSLDLAGSADIGVDLGPAGISKNVDLRGRISLLARPRLQSDWRLTVPDFQIRDELQEATMELALPAAGTAPGEETEENPILEDMPRLGAFVRGVRNVVSAVATSIGERTVSISVRSILSRYLEPEIEALRSNIVEDIAASDFLEESAREIWSRLCTSVPVESGYWLRVKPVRARAAQPSVTTEGILVHLGVEAETQLSSSSTELNCPFPDSLTVEPAEGGQFEIRLPMELDYKVVRRELSGFLVGETSESPFSIGVDEVTYFGAHGRSLLLGMAVRTHTASWLDSFAVGTVYVALDPYLDVGSDTLRFREVRMDTASRNALVAAVAELGEPFFERAIERHAFDLGPTYGQLLSAANDAIEDLSSDPFEVRGTMDELGLMGIQLGAESLRLEGFARGDLSVVVAEIP